MATPDLRWFAVVLLHCCCSFSWGVSVLTTIHDRILTASMSSSRTAPQAADPASYEEALAELDRLLQAMEGGQLPLDRLLESYQRGSQLLTFCRDRLQVVEDQIKVLEEGQLKPWTTE